MERNTRTWSHPFVSHAWCTAGQPTLLCKPLHFRYSFLHALSYDAHFLTDCMVSLVTVAVLLEQYDDLYIRLQEIDIGLGRSQEQQQQLEVILDHVVHRDPAELLQHNIKLQDLASYAVAAAEAVVGFRGKADGEQRVVERVNQLLGEAPVAEWATGFTVVALSAV
jgi:hypothetical protein